MKIKTMLNLSEATVILDTVDLQSNIFQDFLKSNGIKAKVVNKSGPGGGFPEVEYTGDRKAIEELIHKFFGDDDLKDLIEESVNTNLKLLRVYKDKDTEAKMFRTKDNQVLVQIISNANNKVISNSQFNNENEATKWLEKYGYELSDLHEAKNVGRDLEDVLADEKRLESFIENYGDVRLVQSVAAIANKLNFSTSQRLAKTDLQSRGLKDDLDNVLQSLLNFTDDLKKELQRIKKDVKANK